MADVKISALPAATTPLDGTELAPIVQSGTTKRVSIANVTAGRAISASSLTLTTPLSVANGGTGLTSLTAGYIPYATATNTLGTSANLTFDGTAITTGGLNTINDVSNTFTYGRYSSGYPWVLIRPTSTASGIEFRTNAGNAMYQLDQTNDRHLWYTSGTEKMRIASDGSVGIGTTTTSAKLDVRDATAILNLQSTTGTNACYYQLSNTGGYLYIGRDSSTASAFGQGAYASTIYSGGAYPLNIFTNGQLRATLSSDGNLGLGVTPSAWSQGRAFEILNTGYGFWNGTGSIYALANTYFDGGFKYAANGQASHYYQYQGAHVWSNAPNNTSGVGATASFTEAMRIDASGNLLVGTTGTVADSKFYVLSASTTNSRQVTYIKNTGATSTAQKANRILTLSSNASSADVSIQMTDAVANDYFIGGAGAELYAICNTGGAKLTNGATTWSSNSDERLKNIIGYYTDALGDIAQIKPIKFTWKGGNEKPCVGVSAQSVQKVVPEAVDEGADGYLAVRYTEILPLVIASIQELAAKVSALEAKQ